MLTDEEKRQRRQLTVQINERLSIAREALGHSRKDWQELYGVSPSRLSQWENGVFRPEVEFLIKICEDWDLSLDWLMRGKQSTAQMPPRRRQPIRPAAR